MTQHPQYTDEVLEALGAAGAQLDPQTETPRQLPAGMVPYHVAVGEREHGGVATPEDVAAILVMVAQQVRNQPNEKGASDG